MENLNNYKKIQIILLILIIIASILFVMSIVKGKQKNRTTEATIAELTLPIEEEQQENTLNENETNQTDVEIENPEDTSWDEEAEDTKVENPEKEKNNQGTYYLKVNYGANVVTAYKKDKSGNYTVPVRAMICSTGTATPKSGTYKMSSKYRWHQLNGGVYGQYCSRITGHILFHSVPYAKSSPDTLKYTAYDKLGTKASAGCVRLTVADAYWIYSNCASGTYVEFYSSSNPGPLGKPSAQKISSNEKCRNWDPTDPLPSNPWRNYTEPASAPVEQPKEEDNKQEINQNNNSENETQNTQETENNNTNSNNTAEDNIIDNSTSENNITDNTSDSSNTSENDNTANNNTLENNNTTLENETVKEIIKE